MQLIAVDMDGTCLNSRNRISRRALSLLCQRLAIPRSQVGCIGEQRVVETAGKSRLHYPAGS